MDERSEILIVDDNSDNLELLSAILIEKHYTVHTAADGMLALERIAEKHPDLILLDIMMPGIDGFEVCRRLKADPSTASIPVIFISSLNETEDKLNAFHTGGVDYITKPFMHEEVLARISTHLGLYQYKQHLETIVEERTKELSEQNLIMLRQSKLAQMGELISMIAHQWRQPLNILSLNVSKLEIESMLEQLDSGTTHQVLENMIEQIEYMSQTIDDFRAFFKADKEREKQSLHTLVDESMKLLEGGMKSRKITLENDVEGELEIDVFSNEFKQVLINIVNNAIDTISMRDVKDGKIRISSGLVEAGTAIYIQDNGHGIQGDDKERIFEPYFTTKSALNGTGLGLYISKIIIEDHHKGKLRFENSQNGALFTIVIPDNLA